MDIDEARRRLAEHPPQGDPTEIKFGETLAEKSARLEGLKRAMAAARCRDDTQLDTSSETP